MNDAIFSAEGRLTRRDYVLTIAALLGGVSLLFFVAVSILLPFTYLSASAFFREAAVTFWILLFMGAALIFTLLAILLPLSAIPATVRRLHDIGRSGRLAFPLALVSLLALGMPILFLVCLAALLEGMNRTSEMIFFDSPEELGIMLGGLVIIYFILCFVFFPILAVYGAWVFLRKGASDANRYGEPPAEEEIPSVRAAYFAQEGQIDRAHFVFRGLIVLAAAAVIMPALGHSILYPFVIILSPFGLVPAGSDFFALLVGSVIYPLAALPLVIRWLRTCGRSPYEALMVYAALLPNLIVTAVLARFLSGLSSGSEDALDDSVIEGVLSMGAMGDIAFMILWLFCGILTLIGIVRLLAADENPPQTSMEQSYA